MQDSFTCETRTRIEARRDSAVGAATAAWSGRVGTDTAAATGQPGLVFAQRDTSILRH